MTEPGRGVPPPMGMALSTVGFVTLAIAGLGLASLALSAEVLATPGLGQLAGVGGMVLATAVFALTMWAALRRVHPVYRASLTATAGTLLAYLAGVWLGAVLGGADPARAAAGAGGFVTSWFALVLAAAAFVSSWSGIALVRTRAHRPRWPWERDADEP
ncbi:hypothetical protein [Microbacterium sp.]|uniref:hypothetical protein n=1 Tax=Microbacterium sp. TaxID=51671 RepID=UPI0039E66C0E